jgi:hypothetical protein
MVVGGPLVMLRDPVSSGVTAWMNWGTYCLAF